MTRVGGAAAVMKPSGSGSFAPLNGTFTASWKGMLFIPRYVLTPRTLIMSAQISRTISLIEAIVVMRTSLKSAPCCVAEFLHRAVRVDEPEASPGKTALTFLL